MEQFGQYGVLGLVVIALATYIMRNEQAHRKERKDWRESNDKHFDRMNEVTDENNKCLRENTSILSGLKTLLENRK